MSRDEEMYPNASSFNPDRFVTPNKNGEYPRDPAQFIFGFGRRICPGMHFADASLYLMISSILSTFDILLPLDGNGVEYTPKEEYVSSVMV